MKKLRTRGLIPLLVIAAIATLLRLFPQALQPFIDTAGADTQTAPFPDSEYWNLVDGSVYDGDTPKGEASVSLAISHPLN